MGNTHVEELWAELRAIRVWDQDQLRRGPMDEVDSISWVARRIREIEIWSCIAVDCILEELSRKGVIGRA